METDSGSGGTLVATVIPCPFCQEDLAPLFQGLGMVDMAVQCVRCLAAVLFTADREDPEHAARLEALLLEFLPPGETDCRMEIRIVPDVGRADEHVSGRSLHMLAAWNVEELASPALAARILGVRREEVDRLLAEGSFPGAVKGPEPKSPLEQAHWLIPRIDLLKLLED
jgi:hypothetical protein